MKCDVWEHIEKVHDSRTCSAHGVLSSHDVSVARLSGRRRLQPQDGCSCSVGHGSSESLAGTVQVLQASLTRRRGEAVAKTLRTRPPPGGFKRQEFVRVWSATCHAISFRLPLKLVTLQAALHRQT